MTLGSPLTGHPKGTNAWRVFELVSGFRADDARLMDLVNGTPTVPTTSIMSKTDGIVNWRMSLAPESAIAENIELRILLRGGPVPVSMQRHFDHLIRERWLRRVDT